MMTNDYSPVFLRIIEELFGMTIEVGMAAESKGAAEIAERRAEMLSSRVAKANFWKGLHDLGLGFHCFNPYCDECNQILAGPSRTEPDSGVPSGTQRRRYHVWS